MAANVYISYSHEDSIYAKKIRYDLEKAGICPWLDSEDLLPGEMREAAIRQAIRNSQYFLALISKNALTQRGFVHKELKLGLDIYAELSQNSIYIIPASLDGSKATDETLSKIEHVDLSDYPKGFARLLKVLKPGTQISVEPLPPTQPASQTSPVFSPSEFDLTELFVGREGIVEKLMSSGKNSFVFGARRIGKTSLLRFLERKFGEKQIPAFYISIQGLTESEKIKRKLRICFRRKTLAVDETLFDKSFFEFLEESDIEIKQHIVLLIDEAEQIATIEESEPGFTEKLRNIAESSEKIRYIMTASPHFKKVVKRAHCSAFLSAFEMDILPILSRQETNGLMRHLVPGITDDAIDAILQYTDHQPYLIRAFISKLLQGEKLRDITREIAMDTYIANAMDGIFPNYFDGLNEDDQQIIKSIHAKTFGFEKKYESRLRELSQYGYIKSATGEYRISNWFFNHWLDCESGQVGDIECTPEHNHPESDENKNESSEQIVKPGSSKKKNDPETDFWKTATLFQLIYSLGGLLLGMVSIIGGIFLFVKGATGSTIWTAKILGAQSTINDAGPGVVLFIVGLFMVFITRFVIKKRQ